MSRRRRRLRLTGGRAPAGAREPRGDRDAVPDQPAHQPGGAGRADRRGEGGARRRPRRVHRGAAEVRRADHHAGAGRPVTGRRRVRAQRPAGGHRRAFPGDQGVPGRLLPDRLRGQGAGDRAGGADPGRGDRGPGGRGAAGHVRRRATGGVTAPALEDLLRELTPQVLGVLVRRHGQFEGCEDAVQEAVLAAAVQWPAEGVPDNPRGWLVTVASRRLIDQVRSDHARRERESVTATEVVAADVPDTDDTLVLLFLCCHPTLTAASQTALTLRAVGGLTTAEIARAFLVPEATMAARISRAKQRIKAAGSSFSLPAGAEREQRLQVVLHVLYLIFNEGYTASSGSELDRVDLAREAIRLTRMVHKQLPADGEVAGLLALMLLTHARRRARTTAGGDLIPLDEQDRTKWDRSLINEGTEL